MVVTLSLCVFRECVHSFSFRIQFGHWRSLDFYWCIVFCDVGNFIRTRVFSEEAGRGAPKMRPVIWVKNRRIIVNPHAMALLFLRCPNLRVALLHKNCELLWIVMTFVLLWIHSTADKLRGWISPRSLDNWHNGYGNLITLKSTTISRGFKIAKGHSTIY